MEIERKGMVVGPLLESEKDIYYILDCEHFKTNIEELGFDLFGNRLLDACLAKEFPIGNIYL